MSKKINIICVISKHFQSLKNEETDKLSIIDLITFIIIPLSLSAITVILGYIPNKDIISMLVNLGAIFIPLLFSVLVLVYDQANKITGESEYDSLKKKLFTELFSTITYSIIIGLCLVAFCLTLSIPSFLNDGKVDILCFNIKIFNFSFNLLPFLVFCMLFSLFHFILNILMIVKRLHILLISK